MEQWHIKGERLHAGDDSSGGVQWKWQRVSRRGEVIEEATKSFDDIARCLKDAQKHGYCTRTREH